MGWTGHFNRTEYLAAYRKGWTSDGVTVTIRKHHAHGNEDWFILDVHKGRLIESVISLAIWEGGMVKHMDELAGPYFYGCPLEWLDEVPAPQTPYNWRARLRAQAVNPNDESSRRDWLNSAKGAK